MTLEKLCRMLQRSSRSFGFLICFLFFFTVSTLAQESSAPPEDSTAGWIFRWINFAIVLGAIELTANAVRLSVNSEARAARGRTLLEPVLTGLVRAPLIERQTVEQMMASPRDRSSAQDALRLPPNEERRIIHQGLTDHYRRTLDEPIPSLGNQSPRKAAKTRKGREGDSNLQPPQCRHRAP